MGWRIGVDIGGTFTDVALVEEESGRIGTLKVPTTPKDFAQAVLEGLARALESFAVAPEEVAFLAHATTVVTNALLEKKGAKAGFLATRGFRDILELRRSARADLYDLLQDAPSVLVPRRWRFEVSERVDAEGRVLTPLDEKELQKVIERVREAGLETIAVSFLFSFLNDSHERAAGERLSAALPSLGVYLSSEILPEIREFERASTTAVSAYVGPILSRYLGRLEKAAGARGLPPLHVMASSGGVLRVSEALKMPAAAIESGPAAGVIAAALAGKALGVKNLISFDMGGTTAKASLIAEGEIALTAEYEVGGGSHAKRWQQGTGHPVRVPVIDLAEVSAGGGSIAWVDPGGSLRVGPESAGAEPGPAAYRRGGTRPTVSDADLVLGTLSEEGLLGGAIPLDREAAERAIDRHVARPLGLSETSAAAKIVAIVNSNMAEALRIVSIERGRDPREFALLAFGGAGGVHSASLAEELEIPEVIVPPSPGAFSALGLVASDLRRDYARTFMALLDSLDKDALVAAYRQLEANAETMLAAAGIPPEKRALLRSADLRYRRQAYELNVPFPEGAITEESLSALAAAFHEKHRQTYGHANPGERVALVNLRLSAIGLLPELTLRQEGDESRARRRDRRVFFGGEGAIICPVHFREGLIAGTELCGPAIVEGADSTVLVPPGWFAAVDPLGYIRMRKR